MSSDAHKRTSGGFIVAHGRGCGVQPLLIGRAVLGECALAAHETLVRTPYAVADFEASNLRPDGFNRAGDITADDEWLGQFPVVRAVAEIRIDRIDCDSADFNEDL